MDIITKQSTKPLHNLEQDLVIEAQGITAEDLYLLATKKIAAIKIVNYYPIDLCNQIITKIMSENEPGHFEKAKHVQRIGMPHFDIVDAHSFNKYHETALQNIRKLRNIHAPYLSPIDKFRLELDES
ncbi:hypothetical protein [Photobacterium leiognathi]|nr:hypothetical protein [Photobacterium leiognathi]